MRKFTLALATTAMALPLTLQARAADAIVEAPPAPPVAIETAPAYLWAGGYAGVFGGYNWGDTDGVASDTDGWNGGVYGGYNWQADNFVYGIEGDVGYSGADGVSSVGTTAEQGVEGSIRARFGYDLNPVLIYGTAGVAATNLEVTAPGGGASDDNTMIGWTVGAGAETFITENITARLEYRYTDYGSEDFNLAGTNVSTGFDTHSVRAGIGLKF
ncbi:porin family protein [Pseudohoeflea suaedae]|uniref:Porin family protein n=1 Tax=Pseudohoeflea suaedae TaxID=877384 RepID=A0A4R5PPA3_9HYPH|nr:outer membrane protein [Pseudohoeflea suaedae]TDH38914.1 porin family protein [Pseudohoeflea suaedae]